MSSALTVGLPIQLQLVAYGGTPPYTYSIASGIPAGLSLNAATGLVTGTPTTVQSSTALEWSVTDSATPTPATATDTFLVVVQAVPVAVPFYSFPVAATGRWRLRGAFDVGESEPADTVDVSITGQPMTMAAVLGGPATVDVSIIGQPMTMAAVLSGPDTVDVTITGQPMTMAAVISGPATVDVAITGMPMTMAAVVSGPATVDVAIVGSPMTMAAVLSSGGGDADADAYIARLTGSYSGTELAAIEAFFVTLKSENIYSLLDLLYIHALDNVADGLINIMSATFTATRVNSMTFTARRGFTGNGSNMYLNSNFNPATAGGNCTQNSASIGAYNRTNNTSVGCAIGNSAASYNNGFYIYPRGGVGYSTRVNQNTSDLAATPDTSGFYIATRTGASAVASYRNGTTLLTSSTASVAQVSQNVYIEAINRNGTAVDFDNKQIALSFVGGGIDAAKALAFFTAVETLLDAFGAGVVP